MAVTVEVPLALGDCVACAERLREGLRGHRGIAQVEPSSSGTALLVRYDPDLCSLDCVTAAAASLRIDVAGGLGHEVVRVGGMDCYDCAQTIERAVSRQAGVSHVSVSFPAGQMRLEYDPRLVALDQIDRLVRGLGYRVERGAAEAAPFPWWRRPVVVTGIAGALLAVALVLDLATSLSLAVTSLYGASIVVGGWRLARSGLLALRATHRPDINLLMTVAVVGAAAIGAWLEGALVVVLFSVGELLESGAVERARRELTGLVSLTPERARVVRVQGEDAFSIRTEVEVLVAELVVGDLVVVRPGERIPVDGVVREGSSAVDQAPITGESTPVDKEEGDAMFAGTLNGQGLLVVEVGSAPGDTTLDRIARLVAEAQARKSPSERWVDAFARVYTPVVIAAAVVVATVPLAFGVAFADAFYKALALLILACPCALVISTPVSIVSALARASAAGVLVKGGAYLERAATIRTVAFDKTGTLTEGRPRLVEVETLYGSRDEVLGIAASLEQGSEHPLARAIVAAAREEGLSLDPVEGFEALTGLGARGRVAGATVEVGNPKLFDDGRISGAARVALERRRGAGQTAVLVVRGQTPLGVLGLADRPRPEAIEAVERLRQLGITRTVLITGDNEATARAIAEQLGIADVRAELLPEEKTHAITGLGAGVAMVGDGVNDAPALAAADLGVAMGTAGSDTAIEVADVALMGDDPRKLAGLVGLARWTRSVVRQNIAFSLGTKALAVAILALGALPLWGAVASDVGASLIVVANGLLLLRGRPRGKLRGVPLLDTPTRASDRGEPTMPASTPAPEVRS